LLSTTFDEDYLVGELERTLGEIAILTDATPPSVTRLTLPLRYAKRPHVVSFTVRDNLSGVEYKDLKLYIDGVFAVPEIDGERRRVTHRFAEPLTRGSHTVVIRAKDRVGNERNIRRAFFVR
jgi:hypothetical protein